MKAFMDENFMLKNDTAVKLYHSYAENLPLVDYHCHISPKEIFEDRRYNNISEVWLGGKNPDGSYVIPFNKQRPIMLMGPAGIGKTDAPYQVAQELGIGFVSYSMTHHTRQSALGLPKIIEKNYGEENKIVTE